MNTNTPISELIRRKRYLQAEIARIDTLMTSDDVQPERVIWNAAKLNRTTPAAALGSSRWRFDADARRMIAAFLRGAGWSCTAISQILGRGRTTVYYILKSHQELSLVDEEYRNRYGELIELQGITI